MAQKWFQTNTITSLESSTQLKVCLKTDLIQNLSSKELRWINFLEANKLNLKMYE